MGGSEQQHVVPVDDAGWRVPGVHLVRVAGRDVWVRRDARGIVSTSTSGRAGLAPGPRDDAPARAGA
jgi:hypothetical protein